MVRVNTRYPHSDEAYVKSEAAKAKKKNPSHTEGDTWREIVALGIAAHKQK